MEHSRYLVTVDYQQRIVPDKMSMLCDKIKDAERDGRKWVKLFTSLTKAEISYLALYGYRVIQGGITYSTLTEVKWN